MNICDNSLHAMATHVRSYIMLGVGDMIFEFTPSGLYIEL